MQSKAKNLVVVNMSLVPRYGLKGMVYMFIWAELQVI